MLSRVRLFVSKTDLRNGSCDDLLGSLFYSRRNPSGPLLLNIFRSLCTAVCISFP